MTELMKGKRGLVMGVANDHSIAWGIAKALAEHGAELAFTYQGEALGRRVKPLAESVGSKIILPCDVEDIASVDAVFAEIKKQWGTMDFLVHAIGFSDKNELKGRYADTTRANFQRTMVISCFSFTEAAKRAADADAERRQHDHADLQRRRPRHAELQRDGRWPRRRWNPRCAISRSISARRKSASTRSRPGPIRTLAGAGINDARYMFAFQQRHSPLGRGVSLEDLGGAGLYLLSELSGGVTGEIHFVDSGYNIIAMPQPDALRSESRRDQGRRAVGGFPFATGAAAVLCRRETRPIELVVHAELTDDRLADGVAMQLDERHRRKRHSVGAEIDGRYSTVVVVAIGHRVLQSLLDDPARRGDPRDAVAVVLKVGVAEQHVVDLAVRARRPRRRATHDPGIAEPAGERAELLMMFWQLRPRRPSNRCSRRAGWSCSRLL